MDLNLHWTNYKNFSFLMFYLENIVDSRRSGLKVVGVSEKNENINKKAEPIYKALPLLQCTLIDVITMLPLDHLMV